MYKQFNNIMRGSPVPHWLLTKLMTCDHKKPNFTVLFLRHIHIVYSFTLLERKKKPQGGKRGFHSPLFYRGKGTLMLLHFSTSTLLRDTLGCKKIKIAIYQEFRYRHVPSCNTQILRDLYRNPNQTITGILPSIPLSFSLNAILTTINLK